MAGRFNIDVTFTGKDYLSGKLGGMRRNFDRFVDGSLKRMNGATALFDKMQGAVTKVGQTLAVAGTGLGFLGREAIAGGAEFDQAMANVGAVSLMTRDQVRELEVAARRLGKSTKYSATEVAQGMELMGKAGFENKEIVASIGFVLDAAAAEGAAFEETAGIVSNTLKGMGLDIDRFGRKVSAEQLATETKRVADVLTLASARTNSSITSLGESMKNVAPVARQFNIPFEQVAASVALMQDVGIDASEAGTATATMLTRLAQPTDEVAAKMARLGIKFRDAKGDMIALPLVLEQMSKAAASSKGNMEAAAFFADLVGMRGQRAALNLQDMAKNGRFKALADELGDASGKAGEMARLRMDSFLGDMTLLKNEAEDLKIALFDTQSGPLREVAQGMRKWLGANQASIVRGIGDAVGWVRDNFEDLVTWGKRIAIAVASLWALNTAVKTVALGLEAYKVFSPMLYATGKATMWAAGKMGLYNAAIASNSAAVGANSIAAMRMGLNYSKVGLAINGITSPLARIGLLGAAAWAGWELGKLLNEAFGLDKALGSILEKLFRSKAESDKLAGRDGGGKLDANEQYLADGTVLNAQGEIIKRGSRAHELEERRRRKLGIGLGTGLMSPDTPNVSPLASPLSAGQATPSYGAAQPQMVSPQERIAHTITETRKTDTLEVELKTERGITAEITKKPKGRTVRTVPSGAF